MILAENIGLENMGHNIKVKVVSKLEDFIKLRETWNTLMDEENGYDLTLRWEWLFTWWEIFKEQRALFILVVYENKEVIAIAPFLRREVQCYHFISLRRIEFIGSGEDEVDEICSDYLDIIIKSDKRNVVVTAIAMFLKKKTYIWDEIYLCNVRESSTNVLLLIKSLDCISFNTTIIGRAHCPYVLLPETWENLMKITKINSREQINRKRRLLQKEGEVQYVVYTSKTLTTEVFNKFIKLHQSRWEFVGKSGCFSSHKFTSFHQKILERLSNSDSVRLYFLNVNGKLTAARYCFINRNRIYDYQTGFDPSFKSKLGPGFLLLAYCLEDSISNGLEYFDFFKGKKGGYKYKWTDKEDYVSSYIITKKNLKNETIKSLSSVISSLKKLKSGKQV